ncbi:MAG: glycosyltransferase family 2 protein, partial [Candidatus Omnitrophica bacterium]|nr:glycosyltransferase family 2 protein [Candidatus Omnitrophota bacterium]
MKRNNLLIIVPAFNEGQNIFRTIQSLKGLGLEKDILVIDDGSNDSTKEEALKAGVFLISLPFNLGIGGAVQAGFRFAFERGYDHAVRIDADGQHDVNFIPNLIQALRDEYM